MMRCMTFSRARLRPRLIAWGMFTLLLIACWLPTGTASASALDCEGIHDADRRNLCRALAKNDRTYCEFVKNHDLRFECRARVK